MEGTFEGSVEDRDGRRRLPSIDRLARQIDGVSQTVAVRAARETIAAARTRAFAVSPNARDLLAEAQARAAVIVTPSLRGAINATGVIVHTNLGRAPLANSARAAVARVASDYSNLEYDIESGRRGSRQAHVERLAIELTEAEAAVVVNNCAGAVLLAVAALAQGREIVVSRGQLIEIGGSFRIPDVLAASGARLVEVGTTNRTRTADYAAAIGPDTRLLLKVFPSNFRIVGFTESAGPGELAALARERGVPLLVDEGSGLLRPHPAPQLRDHPSLAELVELGCDLACGSGDKLLGGPQAGILLGRAELVRRCAAHPLYRALRPGRPTYALLEATLRRHLAGVPLPLDGMWPDPAAHRQRLAALARAVGTATLEVVAADAYLGGGAAPERPIPGEALAIAADAGLLRRLRLGEPAVVAYARDGRVIVDLRTVAPADDAALGAALGAALSLPAPGGETPHG